MQGADKLLTEAQGIEFNRRSDELNAIIHTACQYFIKEREFEVEIKRLEKSLSNPWLWGFLIASFLLQMFLRDARWYEFKFEFTFATYLVIFWFCYVAGRIIAKYLIQQKIDNINLRLQDLEYRWMTVGGSSLPSFWVIRDLIDYDGELKEVYFKKNNEWLDVIWARVKFNPWLHK